VYSDNTPFAVTDEGAPSGSTLFAARAFFHHEGNRSASA